MNSLAASNFFMSDAWFGGVLLFGSILLIALFVARMIVRDRTPKPVG